MELDDVKQAFCDLDRRLERQYTLTFAIRKDQELARMRSSLRPLIWGHAAQVGVGVLVTLLAVRFWVANLSEPHLAAAGVIVHVYAVLMIALGAQMLASIHRLDLAAPVLAIQKQLALVRRSYVRSGLVIGLPWWLLWIPFAMLLFAGAGVDIYASVPRAWLVANLAVGVIGIAATLWFSRAAWYRAPVTPREQALEARLSGHSFQRAQRLLEAIAEFEKG